MPLVEIYTSPFCGYCFAAKRLLKEKGIAFHEYDVMSDAARRTEMEARADDGRTVPQVFIDGKSVGGSDDLHALAASGELDRLLGADLAGG
ncbi:MAG: glutaredoxin 3 [Pseudomonadota bacterium]